MEAWCLVYKQYLASSLIQPNEVSVFTFPQYFSNNTAVVLGQKMNKTVSTISSVLDSNRGLPLDGYFKQDLDKLRSEGRKLIEIGLFADTRKDENNFSNLVELMSAIARFGVYSNHHDYVIGVHPRRASFFSSIFGFKLISTVKQYGVLNSAPVVLLHACGKEMETVALAANTKIYSADCDLDFDSRYKFNPQNFISNIEFDLTVDNIIRKIWNTPLLKTA